MALVSVSSIIIAGGGDAPSRVDLLVKPFMQEQGKRERLFGFFPSHMNGRGSHRGKKTGNNGAEPQAGGNFSKTATVGVKPDSGRVLALERLFCPGPMAHPLIPGITPWPGGLCMT